MWISGEPGLLHAHILIWLDDESHPRDNHAIDALIRAEIPDSVTENILYNLVKTQMMHGPYGDHNHACIYERW